MKKPDLLKKKVMLLEKKLNQKERVLQKYRLALESSNKRIANIAKDLNENLSLIRDVHKNLLPVKLPHIPGFEFSYKFLPTKQGVSGDFFNVVKIQNSGNFGVLISSCDTYAVTSLFISSFLKASPYLKNYTKAEEFVSFVLKKISPVLQKEKKIHLFYAMISRISMEMDYCLVGDIFIGYKNPWKDWNVLKPCMPCFSKKEINKLKGKKQTLQPKDILLLCSPGVAHRENTKGKLFGIENIIKSVGNKEAVGVLEARQNILFACNEFGKGAKQKKDCTILSIQATGASLKAQSS